MPEGDTILRTAINLRTAIAGRVVQSLQCPADVRDAQTLVGQRVTDIQARGKHLLQHFDQQVLHSHMGMTGSWHLYQPGETWRKPTRRAAIWLQFEQVVAVCFSPKVLELLSSTELRRHRYLQLLGPDVLASSLDSNELLRRFRVHDQMPLGEAVLNQTILCGIGNVYKSEVLFLAQANPFDRVTLCSDEALLQIVSLARDLMHRNLDGYPRRTRFSGDAHRQWVYNRKDKPCFRCGMAIKMRRQGDLGRSTYWCSNCQPSLELAGPLDEE